MYNKYTRSRSCTNTRWRNPTNNSKKLYLLQQANDAALEARNFFKQQKHPQGMQAKRQAPNAPPTTAQTISPVSEFTADKIREDTMDRVESPTARKFAQGVVGVHTNEDRNPSDMFDALRRAVSYARVGTGDEMSTGDEMGTSTPFTPTIHMHFDRVMAANDKKKDIKSSVNLLRAIADAQLQSSTDVDAEDEGHAMALKSERYIDGLNYRAIKSLGACVRGKPFLRLTSASRRTQARKTHRVLDGVASSSAPKVTTWSGAPLSTGSHGCR
jgi:hypothetical protein